MTDNDWKQIEVDRAAGTPGPWLVPDQTWSRTLTVETASPNGSRCLGSGGAVSYTHDVCVLAWQGDAMWDANASRIARVPDLEAYALDSHPKLKAARRIAECLESRLHGAMGDTQDDWEALAAWEAAQVNKEKQ